ncbi:hypothetical protein EAV90_18965 [Bradyrhizobium vignae]|nr:hypothetical protein EAV90_18965 [Bradyrhizobium vignae]
MSGKDAWGRSNKLHPSWPGLTRPSTPFCSTQNVDARDKPGHDDRRSNPSALNPATGRNW